MTATTDTVARTASSREASKLDRRRAKAQAAAAAADAAQARVAEFDDRLAANDRQAREHETALRRAREEADRRKKALKQAQKERERLRKARGKAENAVAKARRAAQDAGDRYDRAVLADLVQREKGRDLAHAAHSGNGKAQAALDPAPERPALGTATATHTAAEKTAAAADGAEPAEG